MSEQKNRGIADRFIGSGVFTFEAFAPMRLSKTGSHLFLDMKKSGMEFIDQAEDYFRDRWLRYSDYLIAVKNGLNQAIITDCVTEWRGLIYYSKFSNIVVDAGINYSLSASLAGGAAITTWYVGLAASSPTFAAADTMSSHGGWTEITGYSESTRQVWTPGSVSGKSVSNTASKAVFSVNASITTGGAFLTSGSGKSGTTGTLFAGQADSNGNRSFFSGDTIQVTYTFSAADDGV